MTLVIFKCITPLGRQLLGRARITGHQLLKSLGVFAGPELKARYRAVAPKAAVTAAQALGALVQGRVVLAADTLTQLDHKKVVAKLGVLGRDDFTGGGIAGRSHAGAAGALGGLPGFARTLCLQSIKLLTLLRGQPHECSFAAITLRYPVAHKATEVLQRLGVGQCLGPGFARSLVFVTRFLDFSSAGSQILGRRVTHHLAQCSCFLGV